MKKFIYLIYILIIMLILLIINCTRYNYLSEGQWNDLYNNNNDNNNSNSFSSAPVISSLSSSSTGSSGLYSRVFGTTDVDQGMAVAADTAGNIYIVCNTYGSYAAANAGGSDILIKQIRSDGTEGWSRQYGSSQDDFVYDIKYLSGYLYITGTTHGAFFSTNSDFTAEFFIIRLNTPDGSIASYYQNDMNVSNIYSNALEVDPTGVYITGYTDGSFNGQTLTGINDIIIAKYSLDLATLVWYDQLGSPSGFNFGTDMVLDTSNNFIYLTGTATGMLFTGADASPGDSDAILAQYNKNGSGLMTPDKAHQYSGNGNELATGIAIDNSGFIYITGSTDSDSTFISPQIGGSRDIFIIKIDSISDFSTMADKVRFGAINEDISTKIKVRNEAGNNYLYTTIIDSDGTAADSIIIYKINANSLATNLWQSIFYSSGEDTASALCLDNFGNVYYTGIVDTNGYYNFMEIYIGKTLSGYAGDDDVFIIKYDSSGNLK